MDKKLMKLVLDCPNYIKEVMLSEHQREIVNMVRNHGYPTMTARELADYTFIVIQAASTQLNNLWRRGYLSREERVAESGGIEYRYKSIIPSSKDQ